MAESMKGWNRTCRCAELGGADVGRAVTLMGWCHKQRDLGGLVFVTLRDRSGEIQLVADESSPTAAREAFTRVRGEYVVAVQGVVSLRKSPNPAMPTGSIEVRVESVRILSESETPPFYIEEDVQANEPLRLKYRYLDLRRPDMQRTLAFRHRIAKLARDYFDAKGFLEVETPMLTKSTPEGARDYLVPSRVHNGTFYALPQSPQLFKQLLMLAGYDRYMQIARCFRDEDLRADRQPEFTQIDLEMAFVDVDDVIEVNEGFLALAFRELMGVEIPLPVQRMTYAEAMRRYGSDKPDLRFGMELVDVSDLVRGSGFRVFADAVASGGSVRLVRAEGASGMGRKEIDALGEFVKTYRAKGLAWIAVDDEIRGSVLKVLTREEIDAIVARAGAKKGDVIFLVADKDKVVFDALGQLRCELARRLGRIRPGDWKLLWVTEFPLLEFDEEAGRFVAMHHPFTSPMDEDLEKMASDPGSVRAKAYDIILNGTELGGGSIRIHDQTLQKRMFALLGFTEEQAQHRFGFLLDAFRYGVPPHGGLAYGLDRLVMLLAGRDSIRDVIAFPKVQTAACLMTDAPSDVDPKQLEELGIRLADGNAT